MDQIGNVSGECPLAELVVISLCIFSPNIPATNIFDIGLYDNRVLVLSSEVK